MPVSLTARQCEKSHDYETYPKIQRRKFYERILFRVLIVNYTQLCSGLQLLGVFIVGFRVGKCLYQDLQDWESGLQSFPPTGARIGVGDPSYRRIERPDFFSETRSW